jgi:hypothetical protein
MFMPTELKDLDVDLADLFLDPHNPRFVGDSKPVQQVDDANASSTKVQDGLLRRFSGTSSNQATEEDDLETTNIKDLRESMLRIGYVAIDKIVVRKLNEDGKYLVIEGNRRVATLKSLFRDYALTNPPLNEATARTQFEAHRASFSNLPVLELNTKGLSKEEIEHSISVILGIRHHGSVLEWEPLPKAFNIFYEYRKLSGNDVTTVEPRLAKAVASQLCISQADVSKAIRTYTVYSQLKEASEGTVRNEDYSLLETAVTNKHLTSGYLRFEPNTCKLDGDSLDRLLRLCQFGRRDILQAERSPGQPKKIIPDPRVMRRLGQILQKKTQGSHAAVVQSFIDNVLVRIEDENDPLTVDEGLDEVINFLAAINWRNVLATLLDEQKKKQELDIDQYIGNGNERGYREEAQQIADNVARIMGIF